MDKQIRFEDVIIENAVVDRDSKSRKMTFIVSDESLNRYGHKVLAEGWNLKNYKKNSPVLINHDADINSVAGKATRTWIDKENKRLMATVQFLDEGISPQADLAFALYDNDILNSVSPGYLVDYEKAEYGKTEKDPKVTFAGQELLEISLATLPANPNALRTASYIQNALELGVIDEDLINRVVDGLEKVEDKVEEDLYKYNKKGFEKAFNSIEDKVIEPEIDYTDKDAQEESLAETDDPYADFYKALDEVNQEHVDSKDPDKLAGQIIESFESDDSNKDSDDVFKSYIDDIFAK